MVDFLFALSLFFFGACVGSFCGVLMERDIKRSFWTGRSQCLSCKKTLHWYELVPLVSYFVQRGQCRKCGALIPSWIISIEVLTGLTWMFFGTLLSVYEYSLWNIGSHLAILTFLLMLAIEDIKTFTIPDRLSLPMILMVVMIAGISEQFSDIGLLLRWDEVLLGGIIGMMFYLLQMMIPGIFFLMRKKRFMNALSVVALPFFFPFWMITKILLGEKKADKFIPTVAKMDNLPSWVGGGDVRLGLLIGLIAGPVYFWWIIGIGYVIGTLFWAFSQLVGQKNLNILP
ncbi:prepilin peptidase, partial [Candidatus Gracilibacteria bacterium]|nr:prepilin peptidase [Candidatus Gracilibacteria bacterium]